MAKKEPLVHITKRSNISFGRALMIRAVAILSSVVIMSVVLLLLAKENPITLIASMFDGAFGTPLRIWVLFSDTAILLGIALALTPAFKMRFWNCGGEGQVMMGSLVTAMMMFFVGDSLPLPLLLASTVLISVVMGAVWGLIPAIFKAKWNTNETLFTLMMNYIAIQCVTYFLKLFGNAQGNLEPMPQFAMPKLLGGSYFLNIALIALICGLMYVYLKYSKHGYEISVVGESERTAQYIGINVSKVIIRTMILSGALCGLIGFLLVANGSCSVTTTIAGGRGFTAILVSWLGKFNPLYMILTSFLVVFLQKGTTYMGEIYRLDTSMADIFIGVVLLFIIGCEFFINYKINFRAPRYFEKRNIVICILLSIITCGIYDVYWMYLLVKNTRSIQKNTGSCIGEMLCLIFVPFYSLYWWYTRGEKVRQGFAEHDYNATGSGVVYLVLAIFGLNIVSMAIMQSDFNSLNSEITRR